MVRLLVIPREVSKVTEQIKGRMLKGGTPRRRLRVKSLPLNSVRIAFKGIPLLLADCPSILRYMGSICEYPATRNCFF